MWIGKIIDALIESEYRVLLDEQRKAANRKSWYALKKSVPPTLLDQETAMNDLKPLARYLSPIAIAISIIIVAFLLIRSPGFADYQFIAIMLALVGIWLQSVTKT